MKGILEFDLEESDDRLAHLRAIKATDMAIAIWEIVYNSRKSFEYEIEKGKYQDSIELLDKVYQNLWEILEKHNIVPDELIN